MKHNALFCFLFVFAFLAAIPGVGLAAESAEKFIYNEEVYREEFKRPRNMASFNRAIGIITDLLREQRRLFVEKRTGTPNDIAERAEEEMNEANLLGSQAKFDEAYVFLQSAFDRLSASIKELVAESGK